MDMTELVEMMQITGKTVHHDKGRCVTTVVLDGLPLLTWSLPPRALLKMARRMQSAADDAGYANASGVFTDLAELQEILSLPREMDVDLHLAMITAVVSRPGDRPGKLAMVRVVSCPTGGPYVHYLLPGNADKVARELIRAMYAVLRELDSMKG